MFIRINEIYEHNKFKHVSQIFLRNIPIAWKFSELGILLDELKTKEFKEILIHNIYSNISLQNIFV